jgi:hypothetical protein
METFKCICCGAEIKPIDPEWITDLSPEESMWNGGVVQKICMPFGSVLDEDEYLIAICDNCIIKKEKEDIIKKL